VNTLPFSGTFGEAQPLVEQSGDALIDDPVADAEAVPAAAQDAAIHQPLKLVRNGLRLHADGSGEIGDAQLARFRQGVQESEPGIVCKDLENGHQPSGLFGG